MVGRDLVAEVARVSEGKQAARVELGIFAHTQLRSRWMRQSQKRQPQTCHPEDANCDPHPNYNPSHSGSKTGFNLALEGHNDCQRLRLGKSSMLLKTKY